MRDYMRFTTEELEFEPGVKFWQRPVVSNIDRRPWRVAGAHDFLPLDAHFASRVERFSQAGGTTIARLAAEVADDRVGERTQGR